MIDVIDFGAGNPRSVLNMCLYLGISAQIISSPDDLKQSKKIILPGVGSFDFAKRMLDDKGFTSALHRLVREENVIVLGICVGAQLLGMGSEEGELPGLGYIKMVSKRFQNIEGCRVPHMGWNDIEQVRDNALLDGMDSNSRFYFAHSFYMNCESEGSTVCLTRHGIRFSSVVREKNIYGVQFHPEKSSKFGMT